MPVGHQEILGGEDVRVGTSEDLGGGLVELVDGGGRGWETYWVFNSQLGFGEIETLEMKRRDEGGGGME